jgi:hypothetical protein
MEHDDKAESKRPIEYWGERKKLLPEWLESEGRLGSRVVKSKRHNPDFVKFAMAKAHRRWPEGKEVSEAEFDEAVAEAGGLELK